MRRSRLACVLRTVLLLFCLLSTGQVRGQYVPRAYYGARFEPVDTVLHGAGQTSSDPQAGLAFENYGSLLGPERYPLVYMAYSNLSSSSSRYTQIRDRLDQIQADTGKYVVPQIGFYIPTEGMPTEDWDPTLLQMANNIKLIGRPVFLRIGYEFNGTWYEPMYAPDTYKAWFQRVTDELRAEDVPAATVWCAFPGYSSYYGSWDYLKDFYPGDEYVDWWGIDVFPPGTLNNTETNAFLDKADEYGKPVLIGEATPTSVGAEDASDWGRWFTPFFEMIQSHKGIKAHTYINYDWSLYPSLSTWGDARLETADPYVRSQYVLEMSSPLYMHASAVPPDELLPGCNAAQADADGDGLGDTCDMCPNTVPGADVDAFGCPPEIACDFDKDGDVDMADFGQFQTCLTGSGNTQMEPDCQGAKLDIDFDVDRDDLGIFVGCLSGSNVVADPACTD